MCIHCGIPVTQQQSLLKGKIKWYALWRSLLTHHSHILFSPSKACQMTNSSKNETVKFQTNDSSRYLLLSRKILELLIVLLVPLASCPQRWTTILLSLRIFAKLKIKIRLALLYPSFCESSALTRYGRSNFHTRKRPNVQTGK